MQSAIAFIRRHPGPWLCLATAALFAVLYLAAAGNGYGYYRRLAASLLSGRLDVPADQVDPLHLRDFSPYRGRYYYPLGVLPAVVLLPSVAVFGLDFPQATLVLSLAALTGWLIYLIARRLNFSERDSHWVSLGVLIASPYAYLVLRATVFDAYLAHLASFACLLGAVAEHLGKRRWWLMGLLVGLSAMSRPLTAIAAVFFWISAAGANSRLRRREALAMFTLPVVVAVLVIAGYNAARFGNPLEAGYSYHLAPPEVVAAMAKGLFSVQHFSGNFRYAFLTGPRFVFAQGSQNLLTFPYLTFDEHGLSLLLTFPLLWLFLARRFAWKTPNVAFGLVGATAIAVPLLLSFAHGEHQYGYRFGFDFVPFLLLALVSGLRGLGAAGRILVIAGIALNAWLTLPVLLNLPIPGVMK